MQDKDFDRFIQQAFENQPEPEYNPADWDMLEDRLHNLNPAQPNAAGTSAGTGMAKLGFVASAVLVTAFNVLFYAKPELFTTDSKKTEQVADQIPASQLEAPAATQSDAVPAVIAKKVQDELPALPVMAKKATELAAEDLSAVRELPQIAVAEKKVMPAVRKAAAKMPNKKNAVKAASAGSHAATTNWAWPSVAANRPGTNSGNSGMSAGQPLATGQPCNPGFKGEIATVLVANDTLQGTRISLTSCQALEARIITKGEPSDNIKLTSDIAHNLPGARLIMEPGSQVALLQWQPTSQMVRQEPYNFTVWVSDEHCNNAIPKAYHFGVQVNPAFTVALNGMTQINKGQEATLEVEGAPMGSAFQWLNGNKIIAENTNGRMVAFPLETTTYRVMVTAPTGCVFTDSMRVEVVPGNNLAKAKVVPNIFTPNKDGINDYFEFQLPEEGPYSLEVYDREGKIVFSHEKYDNRWNAAKVNSGTYYYIITTPQEKKTYKGWVEIVR